MLKEDLSVYYFDRNYNCAESLLRAANDYYDLGLDDNALMLVGSYGAGMQTGNTCGAILAASAVLSLMYIDEKAHESDDIKPVMEILMKHFEEEFGSTLCSNIKPQCFVEGKRCLKAVETACDILQKTISEYEDK